MNHISLIEHQNLKNYEREKESSIVPLKNGQIYSLEVAKWYWNLSILLKFGEKYLNWSETIWRPCIRIAFAYTDVQEKIVMKTLFLLPEAGN